MNSTRTTNFMSSYGEEAKHITSLKDEYFKDIKTEKNSGRFRVKKDALKPSTAAETTK